MSQELKDFEKKVIQLVRTHNESSSKLRDKIQKQIEEKAGDEHVRSS